MINLKCLNKDLKQLRRAGKIVDIDLVVNYNPNDVNSEHKNFTAAINSNPHSQQLITTHSLRYLNAPENRICIHKASYSQQPYSSQVNEDLLSV